MDLRVTTQTLVDQTIAAADQQSTALDQLQEQASSGNRILEPSDDPEGEVVLLGAQERNQQLSTQLTNTNQAQTILNASGAALQQANGLLTQANQLALQANNATASPTSLQALATQADALLGQMLSLANTQQGGQYLFSGTASGTQPFVASSQNAQGQTEAVTYAGSSQQGAAVVGGQQSVTTLYAGNQVFQQSSTSDVFSALANLRDVLQNGAVSNSQLSQSLTSVIGQISSAQSSLQNSLGAIGTAAQTLGSQSTQIQQLQLAVQQQITNVGSADMSTVLVNLQSQQNLLQMTLYSASQMMNTSLLSFLH